MTATLRGDVGFDFDEYRVGKYGPTTLPTSRFTSRDFLALENQKLWPYVWQLVCREDEIPKVGDYLEYAIGDYTVLVIRSDANTIKALSNTCLHRGRQLREGRGNAKEIRCAAHSWRYNLDGSIKEAVDSEDFEPGLMEPTCLQLPEYKIDTWAGWVFINLDPNAAPLMEFLDPVPRWLGFLTGMADWSTLRRRTTIMHCNWKTGIDAFRDIYHLPSVHSQSQLFASDVPTTEEEAASYKLTLYPNGHGWLGPDLGEPGEALAALIPRISPRLGAAADPRADVEETLRGMMAMLVEIDDFFGMGNQDVVDAMAVELSKQYPIDGTDADRLAWWADLTRKQQAPRGLDLSSFTDTELLTTRWGTIFPNIWVANCGVTGGDFFTFRPNGTDPDTCIFEEWFVGLAADSEAAKKHRMKPEFYADFSDNEKNWGRFLLQDLGNTKYMQRGLHNPTQKFMRLGVKDDFIANGHVAIDKYLTSE